MNQENPTETEAERRTQRIICQLTPTERQRVEEYAERNGVSLSRALVDAFIALGGEADKQAGQ